MTVLADDDVLVDGNAERGGDLDDRLGHMDIGLRWRRIAGGGCASKRTSEDFRVGPEAVLSQAGGRLTCYRNLPGWGKRPLRLAGADLFQRLCAIAPGQ